ncbi:hypothetical protein FA09DRAFT_310184 [Tilletiopsis washingtonensis]|uniref:ATP synthase subunit 4 n=1 Tax=Tilletiopsis washingtonensis TaxID=58919 RepID=A0A316Z682_9BASI|nr:hypothetical protein FA09DRAFT_310184 [Tilletiopsis washingtonensis]PWN96564.1 hypothetical protein FA09DRAFT_310184 [Tilletiopsis washingtonensis]
MSLRAALPRAGALRTAARPSPAMLRAVAVLPSTRAYSDKAAPEKRASALLDLLPGNSLISKTSWVTLGTGISALAISKELYVANEETVVLAGFLIFATLVGKQLAAPYAEWADGQIKKVTDILNNARSAHTSAVQSRIDSVSEQQDVVSQTQALFALSKETAQAEQQAFELRQRTALAADVKAVLDSWVRYEAQEREAEQKALTKSVVEKVAASLRDEKTQKQILDDAVSQIEQLVKSKAI